jgi:hypothetical protein
VKAYIKRDKNNAADAEAICEEIMKRDLIWIAVAAVGIPLALSVINAQAKRPRICRA